MSDKRHPCLSTLLPHAVRPDACLYLTDVRLVEHHHAEAALPYTAADGEGQFAFEQLAVAYEGPVYRLALRMCGSAEDAREVAQDAFLAAWRGLPAFRGDSRFSSWLYRLTTNAAIDFLRREKHHLGNLPLEEAPERPDPQQPELLTEQREQQEALQRALDQLSLEHRQVLLLRVVQQMSYDEIAQALSLESGTVKSRISRARRQLREILLRQGNFFSDSAVLPNRKEG